MTELRLDLAVDSRQAVKGIENVADALDDVADAFKDTGRDADRSLEGVEDSLRELSKTAKTEGKKTSGAVKDGLREAKDEAGSSGREAAASFSGGFDDITGFVQETAANAFGGFGAAGAIAGAGAAVGIGLLTAAFEAAEEQRKALEEKASDLAQAYVDAGSKVLDEVTLAARVADVVTSTDPKAKDDLKQLTTALGDRSLAIRVLAGDTGALATANDLLAKRQDAAKDEGFAGRSSKRKSALSAEKDTLEDLSRILEEQSGVAKSASDQFDDVSDSLLGIVGDAKSATREVDEFGNVLYTLPSGAQVVIDAETGQATTDVKKFKGDVDKIPDQHVTNVKAQLKVDASALARYRPPIIHVPWTLQSSPSGRQPV